MVFVFFPKVGLLHEMGSEHMESPRRLLLIHEVLRNSSSVKFKFRFSIPMWKFEVKYNHSPELVELLERTARRDRVYLTPDTVTNKHTWKAALAAAGASFDAIRRAYARRRTTFALVRPPGHHATYDVAMGFCFFNNVALGVKKLMRRRKKVRRVAILDVDQHHGNGTQDAFYTDPSVLYVSLHCRPEKSFPLTGSAEEVGEGEGYGTNVNIPLPEQTADSEYLVVLDEVALPVISQFEPDVLVISAGFDGLEGDPYGNLALSTDGYYMIGRRIGEHASSWQRRTAVILEGGYKYDELGTACLRFFEGLEGHERGTRISPEVKSEEFLRILNKVKAIQRLYWDI